MNDLYKFIGSMNPHSDHNSGGLKNPIFLCDVFWGELCGNKSLNNSLGGN